MKQKMLKVNSFTLCYLELCKTDTISKHVHVLVRLPVQVKDEAIQLNVIVSCCFSLKKIINNLNCIKLGVLYIFYNYVLILTNTLL